jgi:hypothetical protein
MLLVSGSWKLVRKIFTQGILEILRVGKHNFNMEEPVDSGQKLGTNIFKYYYLDVIDYHHRFLLNLKS